MRKKCSSRRKRNKKQKRVQIEDIFKESSIGSKSSQLFIIWISRLLLTWFLHIPNTNLLTHKITFLRPNSLQIAFLSIQMQSHQDLASLRTGTILPRSFLRTCRAKLISQVKWWTEPSRSPLTRPIFSKRIPFWAKS